MPHLARKRMTVLGRTYAARDVVPMDELPAKLRRYMVEQRRVIFEADKPEEIQPKQASSSKAKPKLRRKKKGGS